MMVLTTLSWMASDYCRIGLPWKSFEGRPRPSYSPKHGLVGQDGTIDTAVTLDSIILDLHNYFMVIFALLMLLMMMTASSLLIVVLLIMTVMSNMMLNIVSMTWVSPRICYLKFNVVPVPTGHLDFRSSSACTPTVFACLRCSYRTTPCRSEISPETRFRLP